MTPFPDCPTPEQAKRAVEHLFDAAWAMAAIAKGEGSWDRFVGHIQDGLGEVALEPRPLNPPAPAPVDYAVKCVGAHDRCDGGPCPYCERETPLRDARTGRYAPATAEALFDDAAYSHSRGGM